LRRAAGVPIFTAGSTKPVLQEGSNMKSNKLKIAVGVILAFVMALPVVG
jgi:hypothetical protein